MTLAYIDPTPTNIDEQKKRYRGQTIEIEPLLHQRFDVVAKHVEPIDGNKRKKKWEKERKNIRFQICRCNCLP